jgi:hypothetical protein
MAAVETEISSRQLMEEIVIRAALEFIQGLKKTNKNLDNQLLRELKGLHSNTAMDDLSDQQKKLVKELAQSLFGYVNKNGFVLVPKDNQGKR